METSTCYAQCNKLIAVNLTDQFLCSREAVREFMRRGVNQNVSCSAGKIICISLFIDGRSSPLIVTMPLE